jgi:rhodanese-related sulfurtransferase
MSFLLLIVLCLLLSCNPTQSLQAPTYNLVGLSEFANKLEVQQDSYNLVDVRTGGEFKKGHIKGALNISLFNPTFKKKVAEFDRDNPIFIYCQTGHRSSYAAKWLSDLDFETIIELYGGFKAWTDSAYTISKADIGHKSGKKK